MIDKKYNFELCEKKSNLIDIQNDFLYKNKSKNNRKLFSIILPPPNVTGQLHLGHAWNGTIQDCLIKYKKMRGYNVQWICGMDHAGIATQTKYEKEIKNKDNNFYLKIKENYNDFFNAINNWKDDNKKSIQNQWKDLGFALDYSNEYFTLDKDFSKVINNIFVDLYKKNFIYRDYKLVNWDIKLKTAISDIEVINKETETKFYYIKYLINDSNDFLVVATTRPETIFADNCLVVNPKDKRYKKFIGLKAINPLTDQYLIIIGDDYVDKNFGTGVMKCTPAHDFNDYNINKKNNINYISCINLDGKLNDHCGNFKGLDRIKSREAIVQYLENKKLLVKIESIKSNIGYSERTNEIVEPLLSLQWFLDLKEIKGNIKNFSNKIKSIKVFPNKFLKQFVNWINIADDWCISRQLVWGHRLPVWYSKTDKNKIFVDIHPPKNEENWYKENDVLDTWFSSSLIPLIVSNYFTKPNKLFPTSILVTGYDIIFFWVIKMIFFSMYYTKKMPFENIYITGIMRDSYGKKMSKSLGNGILPEEIIKNYGADSLRLFLLSSSSPGEDLKFSIDKIKLNWSFINKIWNLIRFLENENILNVDEKFESSKCSFLDSWILSKYFNICENYKKNIDKYNFNVAIINLKNFIWNDLCNLYFEFVKYEVKQNLNLQKILFFILKNVLILLHPFIPFFTQYIYNNFFNKGKYILIEKLIDKIKISKDRISKYLFFVKDNLNKYRFDNNINNSEIINIKLHFKNEKIFREISANNIFLNYIKVLNLNIVEININFDLNKSINISFSIRDFILEIDHLNLLGDKKNIEKLEKELDKINFEISRSKTILSNKNFIEKAPVEKVEEEKNKLSFYNERKQEIDRLILNFKQKNNN